MKIHIAYLSLGSNIGNREDNLRRAIKLIAKDESTRVSEVSSLYSTAPVGYEDQPDFLNAVAVVETVLSPRKLLSLCAKIEDILGRKRTIRWGPRVIDIDILLYDNINMQDNDLIIPHPRMMERAFVLVPLADIAPDLVLPGGYTAKDAANAIDHNGIEHVADKSWSKK